ncbi:MAG: energy transducer TonB [Candidatus Omnitrophica bacterium]|nr:energy transducer TonB [Candidatus Omnitrophota bacterium]
MRTFVNKNVFMLFLLISLGWHILMALLVNIVVIPEMAGPVKFSQISFLGSILEETTFKTKKHSGPRTERSDYKALSAPDNVSKLLIGYIRKRAQILSAGADLIEPELDQNISLVNGLISGQRTKDKLTVRHALKSVTYATEQIQARGALSGRKLLYRPPNPQRPRWLDNREGSFKICFKIGVSIQGLVESAVVLNSSGRPALDMLTLSNVRSWKFMPKTDKSEKGLEYGIVEVEFK